MERKFPCSMRTLFVDDEFTFYAVVFKLNIFLLYHFSDS